MKKMSEIDELRAQHSAEMDALSKQKTEMEQHRDAFGAQVIRSQFVHVLFLTSGLRRLLDCSRR